MNVVMPVDSRIFPGFVKEVRQQLGVSQKEQVSELGMSFVTINRWENGKIKSFKLARKYFDNFHDWMIRLSRLRLPGVRK